MEWEIYSSQVILQGSVNTYGNFYSHDTSRKRNSTCNVQQEKWATFKIRKTSFYGSQNKHLCVPHNPSFDTVCVPNVRQHDVHDTVKVSWTSADLCHQSGVWWKKGINGPKIRVRVSSKHLQDHIVWGCLSRLLLWSLSDGNFLGWLLGQKTYCSHSAWRSPALKNQYVTRWKKVVQVKNALFIYFCFYRM